MGSDGLWDVITNNEAAEMVHRVYSGGDVQALAEMLTTTALRRGSMDNTTSVVLDIR